MTKQKKRGLSVIWELAAPLLLYMVISDMTLFAGQMLGGGVTEVQVLPVNAMGATLAAIPLGIWYREKRRGSNALYEQKQGVARSGAYQSGAFYGSVMLIILLAIGACVFFNNLLMILDISSAGFDRVRRMLAGPSLPVQIICTGLVIPFAEELVFRGLVYERLRDELPVWGAVLVSSVYFGIFHGNLVQGIYGVILGCMMAVLYQMYDSLAAAWLFHAAANLTSIFMTRLGMQQFLAEHEVWMAAATAVGGILTLSSAYKIRKVKKQHEIIVHSNPML